MTLDKMKTLDRDDLLGLLGLQTKSTATDILVPALAVFGAGVLVGAGLGLLYAPRPGRELRDDISRRLHQVPGTVARISHAVTETPMAQPIDGKTYAGGAMI